MEFFGRILDMILRKVNFYDHKSRAFVLGDLWIRDGRIAAVGNIPEGVEDEGIDLGGAARSFGCTYPWLYGRGFRFVR